MWRWTWKGSLFLCIWLQRNVYNQEVILHSVKQKSTLFWMKNVSLYSRAWDAATLYPWRINTISAENQRPRLVLCSFYLFNETLQRSLWALQGKHFQINGINRKQMWPYPHWSNDVMCTLCCLMSASADSRYMSTILQSPLSRSLLSQHH